MLKKRGIFEPPIFEVSAYDALYWDAERETCFSRLDLRERHLTPLKSALLETVYHVVETPKRSLHSYNGVARGMRGWRASRLQHSLGQERLFPSRSMVTPK